MSAAPSPSAGAALAWLTGLLATVPPASLSDEPEFWAAAIMGALAAAAPKAPDPRLDQIISLLQGIKTMSETQASSNAALTAAVETLSTDLTTFSGNFTTFAGALTTALATLKSDVGSGAAPNFTAVDAATAQLRTMDEGLATLSSSLSTASAEIAAATAPAAGATISGAGSTVSGAASTVSGAGGSTVSGAAAAPVFDSADSTPNAPGGRNAPSLPGFDATMPATA